MAGYARHRSQDLRHAESGSYWNFFAVPQTIESGPVLSGVWGSIDDVVGNRSILTGEYLPNGLLVVRDERQIPTISGSYIVGGVTYRKLSAFPIDFRPNPDLVSGVFPLSEVDKSNNAWQIIANTNPNNPHVSVPSFVGELKDVPDLIRGWGGSLLRKVAKGHLSWRWGVAPVIADVKKMLKFVDAVDNRVLDLEKLRDGGFLRKRCGLGSSSFVTPSEGLIIHSLGATKKAWRTTTYTSKMWGSARWKLRADAVLPRRGDPAMRKLAWDLVIGRTSYEAVATTWQLLPWSWFVDWFSSVGNVIAAANNTVSTQWSDLCIMRTLTSRSDYMLDTSPVWDPWASLSGPLFTRRIQKERYAGIGPAGPPVTLLAPLVTGANWSILGSIWVLNSKGARRAFG